MFAEDLSAFFLPADFAQAATLAGVDVLAIFDNGYAFGNAGLTGMSSTQPSLVLATASVPTNPVGATAVVGAATYVVAAHEPDGTGISRLLLEVA
jgi:hypothetical protein